MKDMINKTIIILMVFVFGSSVLIAQDFSNTNSDSLNNWVESQLDSTLDTTKVLKIAHLSLYLSNQEKNEAGLVTAFLNLSKYHEQYGQLDSAIYYLTVLKDFHKRKKNKEATAQSCLQLKGLYGSKAAYSEAMEQVFEALELYESIGNQKGIASCYSHICDLLYYEDKYQESADYCDKAIAIQKEIDEKTDLAISYRYKASSLLFVEGALEQALQTVNKSINVYNVIGETGLPLLASINGRGNILKYMKRYDEAIADYQFIYEKVMEMGMENYAIPPIANIGHVYLIQEKYEDALPYILEAIELMKKSGNTKNLWENYMHASDIYNGLGDYKKAYDYNILYSGEYAKYLYSIIDRLESELQIKYETAKKNETIQDQESKIEQQNKTQILYISIALLLLASLIGMLQSRKKIRKKQQEIEKSKEELQLSLESLKATQAQLIHSEKMASLGELTAGIAHEIQNPLNFVNNFSEVSVDMMSDLTEEMEKGNVEEIAALKNDLKQNLSKISEHGKRASNIVKGMLEHSRSGNGEKVPTDINALVDEYLRLSYHGLRAKDKSFRSDFKLIADEYLPKINVVPQDIGRVLLNLINNAFYAVNEKLKNGVNDYEPSVVISTKSLNSKVEIRVHDNGNGIPNSVKEKIFQPFFTTKPTGEGTGLGLSMSYDIITKGHDGKLELETKEGEGLSAEQAGTTFIIQLPV